MILFLNSSPRKNGVTATLLRNMEKVLKKHGIERLDVNSLKMKPCTGCLRCRPDKACVLPRDDAHRAGELINGADAIVIGLPTYWGNMTGPLKILFDRNVPAIEFLGASLFPRPMQKGKPAAIVLSSTAPFPYNQLGSQSRGAIRAVKTILHAAGCRTLPALNIVEGRYRKNAAAAAGRAEKLAGALSRRAARYVQKRTSA
jgi:multimeric flavodoxin WrbA